MMIYNASIDVISTGSWRNKIVTKKYASTTDADRKINEKM